MAKGKRFILQLILLCTIHNIAGAQSYTIESLEGVKIKINLDYKLFSKTLTVSNSNDTLFLDDYTGTIEVHLINRRFLQVDYGVRGGSGLGLRKTLILSVSKSRINASMLVTSYTKLVSFDKEQFLELKLKQVKEDRSNYEITGIIHVEKKFKQLPQKNSSSNEHVALEFDANENVFYSSHETISGYFKVYDDKIHEFIKKHLNNTVPVITIESSTYYFVNGEWYERSDNDTLVKYSHRNG
jgi:hypothetical protein